MFKLKLFDRKGVELHMGDIVKISDGRRFNFYCEVTYLKEEQAIAPFHTFSFHSVEKVDKVPEAATKSTEERYNIWYDGKWEETEEDTEADAFKHFLMSWRECEYQLRCWKIELVK